MTDSTKGDSLADSKPCIVVERCEGDGERDNSPPVPVASAVISDVSVPVTVAPAVTSDVSVPVPVAPAVISDVSECTAPAAPALAVVRDDSAVPLQRNKDLIEL